MNAEVREATGAAMAAWRAAKFRDPEPAADAARTAQRAAWRTMEAVKHEEVHLAVRVALSPAGKRDVPGREDAVLKRLAERRATIASGRGRRWFERARGSAQKAVLSAQIAAGEQERMLRGKPPCATCGHEVGRAAPLANEAQVLLCSFNEWGVSGPEWLLTEGAWWRAYRAWRTVVDTRDALNDWAQKGTQARERARAREGSICTAVAEAGVASASEPHKL